MKTADAVAAFSKEESLDPQTVTADNWNDLCWFGTLQGDAREVLNACDRAVDAAPTDWHILDSRGLALGIVGDTQRAIADFTEVVKNADTAQLKKQRSDWITALGHRESFPPEGLDALRMQYGIQPGKN